MGISAVLGSWKNEFITCPFKSKMASSDLQDTMLLNGTWPILMQTLRQDWEIQQKRTHGYIDFMHVQGIQWTNGAHGIAGSRREETFHATSMTKKGSSKASGKSCSYKVSQKKSRLRKRASNSAGLKS